MKKINLLHEKNAKLNKTLGLPINSLKSSRSEIFLTKRTKKQHSTQKQTKTISKNDLRLSIYVDKLGFIVEYSILAFGLKCQCFISQTTTKRNSKSSNINLRQNSIKKRIKLIITLNTHQIAIIKGDVQHIFPLLPQPKHNFLKIVLIQNWQIQQFHIPNKKIKICDGEILSASQKNYDQIYPLNNIIEADQLRKSKLLKCDSKVKINWSHTTKDIVEQNEFRMENQSLSLLSLRLNNQMTRSMIITPINQIPKTAFLRKSFNQNDQTRDSEEQRFLEEKHFQKREKILQTRTQKALSINLSLWNQPGHKQQLKTSRKQQNYVKVHQNRPKVPATQRFLK